jgi:hypothetical protein
VGIKAFRRLRRSEGHGFGGELKVSEKAIRYHDPKVVD